jgi:hypothetical protein
MSFIQNFFTSRDNNANTETYVGQQDRLWYNPDTNSIRISDGVTPGGLVVDLDSGANANFNSITANTGTINGNLIVVGNISAATANTIGGIIPGPGANVSNTGLLTIDTTGLPLSFGNFTANNNILTIVNNDENMILVTQGNAEIQLVGNVGFYRTNGLPPNIANRYFRASDDGQILILVSNVDPLLGAVEIVGSTTGNIIAPGTTGTMLHITGQVSDPTRVYIDGNDDYVSLVARRWNGTVAVPTQVLANQYVLRINSTAATDAGVGNVAMAQIGVVALEDQTTTAQGSKIEFNVTAIGNTAANRVAVANITVANGVSATKFTSTGNITAANFIGDGSQLTNLPPPTVLSAVASANVVVADSLVATTITGMTLTPPAGTYLATFSSQYTAPLLASVTAIAAADLAILYAALMALTPTVTGHAPAYGSGETLGPGVYTQAGASSIAGTLTLNGGPTDIFVFRCAGALTTGNGATIVLTGGAVSSNVWWVAQGAISTGSDAVIRGSLLANQAAVAPGARAAIQGRLLAVNGAIGIDRAVLTEPTGTSVLDQGSLTIFSIFAGIGALTNAGASNIALSIGTNDGTITGFETATVSGEIYPAGAPELAVISYGIYVDGVLIANSKRGQTQTRVQSGWPMATQTLATVTTGQTIDVRATVPYGGFDIGPGMSLVLLPTS